MNRVTVSIAALGFASSLSAQAPVPTIQQRFEAAAVKLDAKDAAGALADLDRLEADLVARPKPLKQSLALVRARKGEALAALGRTAEARAALRAALAGGALDAPAVAIERDSALLRLARFDEAELDLAGASESYARLATLTQDVKTRIFALVGAGRTSMFIDGAKALAYAEQAVVLADGAPAFDKADLSIVLGTKARILLNSGSTTAARRLLDRAVALRGGMTTKVDQWDIALRADAALAALRSGDKEAARRYLAFSGAGMTKEPLSTPSYSLLPDCIDLDGVTPEDSVIVQFAILDDGRVVGAQPVLASKPGPAAVEFARHVSQWSWNPEEVKKVDLFFRVATRVELRCSNRPDRPQLTGQLDAGLYAWLDSKGVALDPSQNRSAATYEKQHRASLDAARQRGDKPAEIAALWLLAQNVAVPAEPALAMLREAIALLPAAGAPASAKAALGVGEAYFSAYQARPEKIGGLVDQSLRVLLADPAIAGDPGLRASINILLAKNAGLSRWRDRERAAVLAVTEDSALAPRDPLKVAALVMLANIEALDKRFDAAHAAYARTGLTAQQCALIDGGPVLLKTGASSSDFPMEAMNWGFEGWAQVEYDVAADGKTRNIRTIMAYPPAVFSEAGEGVLRGARYRASYRPENDLGCSGATHRVRFQIPGK